MKAESNDAINQQLIEMDAAAAREQNLRASEAEQRRSQSITQGVQAIGGTLQSASGDITKQQYKGFKKKPSSFSYESIFGKGFDPYKT